MNSLHILIFIYYASSIHLKDPKVVDIGFLSKYMFLSDSGKQIVMSFDMVKDTELYVNNGETFTFDKPIPNSILANDIFFSHSGKKIIIDNQDVAEIFDYSENGNLSFVQGFQAIYRITQIYMSEDDQFLVVGSRFGNTQILQRQSGTENYSLIQSIVNGTLNVKALSMSKDNEYLAIGNTDRSVHIYRKIGSTFIFHQYINQNIKTKTLKITNSNLLIAGFSNQIIFFKNENGTFIIDQVFMTNETVIRQMDISEDFQVFAFGGDYQKLYVYKKINGVYQEQYSYDVGATIYSTKMSKSQDYFAVLADDNNLYIFYVCPEECSDCNFPENCSSCKNDFILKGTTCVPKPTHCVNNVEIDGICEEYCNKQCKTCNESKDDCYQCAEFYKMNDKGECVIENNNFDILLKVRPFVNFIKRKGIKSFFLAVDDLWLYQYHQLQYDGTVDVVFRTIRFVEEKQWELVGLQEVKEDIENSYEDGLVYNQYSNDRYITVERQNNLFISSTFDFFTFFVPATLIVVFLFNRIFYLLFDCEISKYLRPYCFLLIIFELLIQNNVEYFTFLGLRSLDTSFTFEFSMKWILIVGIFMLFLTLIASISSYFFYYAYYGKMARYFLVSMFRFPSSYALMMIMYGFRPLVKGALHAMLYEHWFIQIWCLMGTEILVLLIIFFFQFNYDNHKSKIVFMLETTYYACLVILNILLLLKYEYFKEDNEIKNLLEELIYNTVWTMIFMIVLRVFWDLFPWDFFRKLCQDQVEDDQNSEDQNKKKVSKCNIEETDYQQHMKDVNDDEGKGKEKVKVKESKKKKNEKRRNGKFVSTHRT